MFSKWIRPSAYKVCEMFPNGGKKDRRNITKNSNIPAVVAIFRFVEYVPDCAMESSIEKNPEKGNAKEKKEKS